MSHFEKDSPSLYSLQKHKKSKHDKSSRLQDLAVDFELLMGDYHDQELSKVLTAYQQFLVDSRTVKCRQHVINFA